ncbi:hypothetical protein M5K25_001239 [Dendrobium thyrsiflorum]|uniref:Uncharacterized protein n=1 Tax=Dendrobium thyrsiflorum TaxID=117978 RepID=A0ABD0VQX5_DENTH
MVEHGKELTMLRWRKLIRYVFKLAQWSWPSKKGRKCHGAQEKKKEKGREEGKEGRNSSSTTAGLSSDAGVPPGLQVTPDFPTASKLTSLSTALTYNLRKIKHPKRMSINFLILDLRNTYLNHRMINPRRIQSAQAGVIKKPFEAIQRLLHMARLLPIDGFSPGAGLMPVARLLPEDGLSSDIYPTLNFFPSPDVHRTSGRHRASSSRWTYVCHQTFIGLLPDVKLLPNAEFLPDAGLTPVAGLLPEDGLSSDFYSTLDFYTSSDFYPSSNLRPSPYLCSLPDFHWTSG